MRRIRAGGYWARICEGVGERVEERRAAFRSRVLNLAKTCSMGLRSGEYFGRNTRRAPTLRMVASTDVV